MGIDALLKEKRGEIIRIAEKHGAGNIRVFGSVARGEADENSDVDFLIEVKGATPPWFPGGLVADLAALLGRRVDVVETSALRPGLKSHVLEEATPL